MLALLTLLALLQPPPAARVVSTESSYVDLERFDFSITKPELDRQAPWSSVENDPPLSPRHAVHAAEGRLLLLMPEPSRWHLATIMLRPTLVPDVWVYTVEFQETPRSPLGGLVQSLRVPVLMDGTAVDAKRSPWPEKTK